MILGSTPASFRKGFSPSLIQMLTSKQSPAAQITPQLGYMRYKLDKDKRPLKRYLAHSKNTAGNEDPLAWHLCKVADRAAAFASSFGASEEAKLAGLLHDLGKYGDFFQARLAGKERGIDHWSPGAWQALMKYKINGLAPALAIQGHHIGLQKAEKQALAQLNPVKAVKHHIFGLRLSDPDGERLISRFEADGLNPSR